MQKRKSSVLLIALVVAMGGFVIGFDASVISGVIKFIEPQFNLSKIELGWAVASLSLTATAAMMFAGPLSDKYGRVIVLKYSALLYAFSALLSALAPSFFILVAARMLAGIGVGISLIVAPMYIAEIAPAEMRGRMVSFNQLNIVIGLSAAFFTNYLIVHLAKSDASWIQSLKIKEYNWRWMLGLEFFPAVLAFVASFAISLGPVMWVLFSELFPNKIRGLAISFVGFINTAVSFLVQLVIPWELAKLGSTGTFLLYGIFALAGLIFIMKLLPETKGKSLEQLEAILVK